jgi:hypothetical protein
MTTTHKIILSVTFLVLTAVFLFPARRYSDGTFHSGSGTAPRVAILSRGIYFGSAASNVTPATSGSSNAPGFWVALDGTRIALEAFLAVSISGVLLVLTTRRRPSSGCA